MTQKEVKRISVRFYYANNADLIDRAVNTSGVSQSEWCRRALVEAAEFQIHAAEFMRSYLETSY